MFEEYTPYDDCEPAGLELPSISLDEQTLSSLNLDEKASSLDILRQLARRGIIEKGIDKFPNKKQYYDRVLLEIQVFDELGFIDYVLLNWEIVGYAKKNKFCVGDGRGSGASSLVLYLLNVTNIDPIEHNLYFERFVSKSRAKKVTDKRGKEFLVGSLAPDVDTDVSHVCRPKLIEYIEDKYKGRTSKILTFNTFSAKLCIKEVVKYFGGYSEDEANIISDMVPKQHGVVLSLKKSVEESEKFAEWVSENKDLYLHALVLENLNKNVGVHPSGIAICAEPVEKVIPLQLTKEGSLVSAYDMGDVSDLMVKFDILGLKTLTTADRVCKRIGINLEDVDANDPFIYRELQDFKYPSGLFQISAPTNFRVIKKVQPLNLNELSDSIAIGRPAALQFLDEYVSQKNSLEKLGIDETLDKILASTKNVMLFQEQTMKVCHEVFGMTLDDAEQLRRCITGDTRFLSKSRGWIKVETLLEEGYEGDKFWVMNPDTGIGLWKAISAIWSNGIKQVHYVEAENGMTVKASQYHQFATADGWKARSRLEENDYLISCFKNPITGEKSITNSQAIVLAGMVSEGYFVYGSQPTFTNYDKCIYDKFYESAVDWFGEDCVVKRPCGKVISLKGEAVDKLGSLMFRGKSAVKDIPEIIFRQSFDIASIFIGFLFACEGTIINGELSITSKSSKLIYNFNFFYLKLVLELF